MFTLEKANKLLNIVYKEYPSLKDDNILIKSGNEFSVTIDKLNSIIEITEFLDRKNIFCKYINKYLKKEFDLDGNQLMFDDYEECFSFLHEVGHIYYNDDLNDDSIEYMNFKNKVHQSYKSAFLEYRSIPSEKMADTFAAIMLKSRLEEIWAVMQETTIEKAKEEIQFWFED